MALDLKKKMGPLPVWSWGLLVGVAVLYYMHSRAASSATSSTTGTATGYDPNAIDPATGISYGQEESAALNATAGNATSSGSLDTSGSTATNIQNLSDLMTVLQGMGWGVLPTTTATTPGTFVNPIATVPVGSIPAPVATPAASPLPDPIAATPPPAAPAAVVNPPAAAPNPPVLNQPQPIDVNKLLLTSAGIGPNEGAQGFIQNLAGLGYKAGKGAASGTYTKAGSSLKYFVFQLGGQTHVRQAH